MPVYNLLLSSWGCHILQLIGIRMVRGWWWTGDLYFYHVLGLANSRNLLVANHPISIAISMRRLMSDIARPALFSAASHHTPIIWAGHLRFEVDVLRWLCWSERISLAAALYSHGDLVLLFKAFLDSGKAWVFHIDLLAYSVFNMFWLRKLTMVHGYWWYIIDSG